MNRLKSFYDNIDLNLSYCVNDQIDMDIYLRIFFQYYPNQVGFS